MQLLIFIDWYKHSNSEVSSSKCNLNHLRCIIWRQKQFSIKTSALHNGLHNKFGLYISYFHWFWIWHILIIHCAKFEAYTCSICDVVTIPINACSSLFNRLSCCWTFLVSACPTWVSVVVLYAVMHYSRPYHKGTARNTILFQVLPEHLGLSCSGAVASPLMSAIQCMDNKGMNLFFCFFQ